MKNHEIKTIGKHAASLSIIEIGLGSLLHAASIPLAGQILSINQMAILARASFKENSSNISLKISLISSILKSLSPAGKKLTPMLAILAQGLLFSVGLTFLGINYLGLFLAITLASAWAFIQPLLLLYLLFGQTIVEVVEYFKKDFTFITNITSLIIIKLLIITYILKIVIAYIVSINIIKMSDLEFENLQQRLNINSKKKQAQQSKSHLVNAFFDLCQPLFIATFVITSFFLYYSHGSLVNIVWVLLRPIAVGLVIFYIIRVYPIENFIHFLEKKGMTNISKSLKIALETIKKNREL